MSALCGVGTPFGWPIISLILPLRSTSVRQKNSQLLFHDESTMIMGFHQRLAELQAHECGWILECSRALFRNHCLMAHSAVWDLYKCIVPSFYFFCRDNIFVASSQCYCSKHLMNLENQSYFFKFSQSRSSIPR